MSNKFINETTPEPRSSKLTNFVYKVLSFVPTFSAKKKLEYEKEIFELRTKVRYGQEHNLQLRKDYEKLMVSVQMPRYGLFLDTQKQYEARKSNKITIRFDDLHYTFCTDPASDNLIYVDEYTEMIINEAAEKLGKEFGKRFAKEVFSITLEKYRMRTR